MSQEMQKFDLNAQSYEQAMQYAKLIADSDLAPKDFKGKPGNVLIAVQMGADVGLKPMQAIQNIAIINGRPSLWGDGLMALILASKHHGKITEIFEGAGEAKNAICFIVRKNTPMQNPIEFSNPRIHKLWEEYGPWTSFSEFSVADAKTAGLWKKVGPWTNYPDRMLKMRARAFAIRDAYADVLKGLSVADEQNDIETYQDIQESKKEVAKNKVQKLISEKNEKQIVEEKLLDFNVIAIELQSCDTLDTLRVKYESFYKTAILEEDKKSITAIKDGAKSILQAKTGEIENKEWLNEFDGVEK